MLFLSLLVTILFTLPFIVFLIVDHITRIRPVRMTHGVAITAPIVKPVVMNDEFTLSCENTTRHATIKPKTVLKPIEVPMNDEYHFACENTVHHSTLLAA